MQKRFRTIVWSDIEPQDTNVLWYWKGELLYFNNGEWQPFHSVNIKGALEEYFEPEIIPTIKAILLGVTNLMEINQAVLDDNRALHERFLNELDKHYILLNSHLEDIAGLIDRRASEILDTLYNINIKLDNMATGITNEDLTVFKGELVEAITGAFKETMNPISTKLGEISTTLSRIKENMLSFNEWEITVGKEVLDFDGTGVSESDLRSKEDGIYYSTLDRAFVEVTSGSLSHLDSPYNTGLFGIANPNYLFRLKTDGTLYCSYGGGGLYTIKSIN